MTNSNEISIAKKQKTEETSAKTDLENVLNEFHFVRILNENAMNKLLIIEAVNKNEQDTKAVVVFEKSHFNTDEIKSYLAIANPSDLYINNDAYKKMAIYPSQPFNSVQVQLIYPATEAHITKYSKAECFFLLETAEDWQNTTSPYLKEKSFDLTWVYNILEHKKEMERIIFEDEDKTEGFVLLPDMKWDGQTVENLYLLGIVHARGIGSLRDLTAKHISLLKNVRDKSLRAIEEKYGLHPSRVRVYLHYYPSFYHLHLHFTHINFQLPGWPERNHLINQVICNLSVDGDYYRKVALECVIKQNDGVYDLYKDRFNE